MPTLRTTNREAYAFIKKRGLVRPRDLEEHGIPRAKIARWANKGLLVRTARGLYALPNQDFGEHDTLVQVAKLVPGGIVCLLSALRLHGLTTQNPSEVWLGIDRKARKPKLDWPPLHVVWWSDAALSEGIIVAKVSGISVWVGPSKVLRLDEPGQPRWHRLALLRDASTTWFREGRGYIRGLVPYPRFALAKRSFDCLEDLTRPLQSKLSHR